MACRQKNTSEIPDYVIESLARAILPAIQKMFEDEKIQKDFEKWKAKKEEKHHKRSQTKAF